MSKKIRKSWLDKLEEMNEEMTQNEIADKCGVSYSTVWKWFENKTKIRDSSKLKINIAYKEFIETKELSGNNVEISLVSLENVKNEGEKFINTLDAALKLQRSNKIQLINLLVNSLGEVE